MTKSSRGFTLIELLVVIAIIGVLSSVVLASLNTARNKGNDAAVKSNLNGIRSQAELFYDSNSNSYASVCSDSNVSAAVTAAVTAGGAASCYATSTAWGVTAKLRDGTYWCVDSYGNAKLAATTATSSTDYNCN